MAKTSAISWPSVSTGQAFFIHLILSLLIFSSLVLVMFYYWFPGELFFLDGGWQGLKLVAMVDLVLGPALTLVLYKPGKPKVMLDMGMIAAFQIAALAYGFYTTHEQRTVAVVFSEGQFQTLSNVDQQVANETLISFDVQPNLVGNIDDGTPAMLLAPEPSNYGKYLEDILNGYPAQYERTDRLLALNTQLSSLRENALSEDELQKDNKLDAVQSALSKKKLSLDSVELYKFKSRYSSGIAAFDPTTARIVDYIPIDSTDASTDVTASAEEES